MKRKGFADAYDGLEDEYLLVRELLGARVLRGNVPRGGRRVHGDHRRARCHAWRPDRQALAVGHHAQEVRAMRSDVGRDPARPGSSPNKRFHATVAARLRVMPRRSPQPCALTSSFLWRTVLRTYQEAAMTTITATEARKLLYKLLDDVSELARARPDHGQARQRRAGLSGRLGRRAGDAVPGVDPRHARVDPRGHGHAGR